MKNNLFSKATALVMGSLVIFSGQALAFSSNNQELSNTGALGDSETLVSQGTQRISPQQQAALCQSIALTASAVGNAVAVAQSVSIPSTAQLAIARSLAQASTLIGDALARARCGSSLPTEDDVAVIVELLTQANTLLDDVLAIVQPTEENPLPLAVAGAKTAVGNAIAVAKAI